MPSNMEFTPRRPVRFPTHGYAGIILVAVSWIINWNVPGLRTHWAFFPLWAGYCLTVDGMVVVRKGSSMLTRNTRAYGILFLISAPAWWLFELINWRTANWLYEGREYFTALQYALLASLSFSTVMPAVFSTAELAGTFSWLNRWGEKKRFPPATRILIIMFAAGWAMLALMLYRPQYFFPFVWGSIYCILEPVNVKLGYRSLFTCTAEGNWRPVVSLWIGGIVCGFFWEMWNYFSYPRWVYHVPHVDVLHVFEMPLPGYLGYFTFALELSAVYHFVTGLLRHKNRCDFWEEK